MKEINIAEAADWTDEEAAYNIHYLESRTRYADADEIRRLRGDLPPAEESKAELEGMNVNEVLDWVGSDKEKAQKALDFETSKDKPRTSLVDALEDLLAAE